ncbi:hypothetical protein ACHQM5_028883 [Ranunculus cassubicifolius]
MNVDQNEHETVIKDSVLLSSDEILGDDNGGSEKKIESLRNLRRSSRLNSSIEGNLGSVEMNVDQNELEMTPGIKDSLIFSSSDEKLGDDSGGDDKKIESLPLRRSSRLNSSVEGNLGSLEMNDDGKRKRSSSLAVFKKLINEDVDVFTPNVEESEIDTDLEEEVLGSNNSKKARVDENAGGFDNGMLGLLVPILAVDNKDNSEREVIVDAEVGSSKRRSERLAVNAMQGGDIDKDAVKSVAEMGESSGDGESEVETVGLEKRRYSEEEKGKKKMDLSLEPEVEHDFENVSPDKTDDMDYGLDASEIQLATDFEAAMRQRIRRERLQARRERFQEVARRVGPQFAHFRDEEGVAAAPASEDRDPLQEIEDWPGPFSTAMKIIKDRSQKRNVPQLSTVSGVSISAPDIHWVPSMEPIQNRVKRIPSTLEDLCLNVLLKNFEAIHSLEFVPVELKDKLCQLYCDISKMDIRFMRLLIGTTPEIVRVKNCSWMTEEEMTECFGQCNLNKLSVLQLDLCGRCLPDYVLRTTLVRSPKCLPALITISLKGGCRITDTGLSLLVAAAPSLRSMNLSACSLLTSTSINTIADSLGLLLKELYLDYCEAIDVDVMLMLPALTKLKCLEVLSLQGMQTVCDDFVTQFVSESGAKMKELVLGSCVKLTDESMKAIAEKCSGLYALDISNLPKLTDMSIGYIANGCSLIQKLELRRNAFSDEAIAALLEACGESITVLSLCKNVGPNTAISLARRCTRNLLILDLSFCRKLNDEAMGYIIDSCLSLRLLKVFGCTQITRVLVDGHSNPLVQIVGFQLTASLENLDVLNLPEVYLRYSAVPALQFD